MTHDPSRACPCIYCEAARARAAAARWKNAARAYRAGELEATAALEAAAAMQAGILSSALTGRTIEPAPRCPQCGKPAPDAEGSARAPFCTFACKRAHQSEAARVGGGELVWKALALELARAVLAIEAELVAARRRGVDIYEPDLGRAANLARAIALNAPSEKRSAEQCPEQFAPGASGTCVGATMKQENSRKAETTEGSAEGRTLSHSERKEPKQAAPERLAESECQNSAIGTPGAKADPGTEALPSVQCERNVTAVQCEDCGARTESRSRMLSCPVCGGPVAADDAAERAAPAASECCDDDCPGCAAELCDGDCPDCAAELEGVGPTHCVHARPLLEHCPDCAAELDGSNTNDDLSRDACEGIERAELEKAPTQRPERRWWDGDRAELPPAWCALFGAPPLVFVLALELFAVALSRLFGGELAPSEGLLAWWRSRAPRDVAREGLARRVDERWTLTLGATPGPRFGFALWRSDPEGAGSSYAGDITAERLYPLALEAELEHALRTALEDARALRAECEALSFAATAVPLQAACGTHDVQGSPCRALDAHAHLYGLTDAVRAGFGWNSGAAVPEATWKRLMRRLALFEVSAGRRLMRAPTPAEWGREVEALDLWSSAPTRTADEVRAVLEAALEEAERELREGVR